MLRKSLSILLFSTLLLAACAAPTLTVDPIEVAEAPGEAPDEPLQPTEPPAYPAPAGSNPDEPVVSATSVYPEPADDTSLETSSEQFPPSEYDPAPGDDAKNKGPVFLELDSSALLIMESYPVQVVVTLIGSLPDPCYELRVERSGPDADNRIDLDVYSLVDPGEACITVIEPFEASIPLGSYAGGTFSIWVNGEKLGDFDA